MELSEPSSQTLDSFWGVELSGKNRIHEFEEEADEDVDTVLELRQACLGADAKEGRNVVQVITQNEDDETVTHTLLSMRIGGTEMAPLFVTLRPPSKLELVKGNGPIHILGTTITHLVDISSEDEDDEEEEEEEEETIVPIETQAKKGKKRSAPSPANQPSIKSARMIEDEAEEDSDDEEEGSDEEDADEDEEDGEEEEEEELERFQKPISSKKGAKNMVQYNNVDEWDDESMSEDEDEESEEETMEIPPPKTKKQTPSKAQFKTPQSQKSALKSSLKSPMSAPKPKKGSEKKPAGKPTGPLSVDEIKKKLATSPNLPKKLDKFNNYMSNNFKVSDAAVKKQLWEFVQKSKK